MTTPLRRYLLLLLLIYACWGGVYLLTAWIGAVRGPAFEASTCMDAVVPYMPAMYPVYLLCYISPLGLFLLSRDARFLTPAYTIFIIANLAAFWFFAAFPVQGPPRDGLSLGADTFLRPVLDVLYSVDTRYDALPSLHVTNPWIVAILSWKLSVAAWKRVLVTLAAAGISVSTMLVHQHWMLDVVAGIALAALAAGPWRPGRINAAGGQP